MLRGEPNSHLDQFKKVESLICSDLDHWLCNMYFQVCVSLEYKMHVSFEDECVQICLSCVTLCVCVCVGGIFITLSLFLWILGESFYKEIGPLKANKNHISTPKKKFRMHLS